MKQILAVIVIAALPFKLLAQEPTVTFMVDLFGWTATYAAPPWIQSSAEAGDFEMSRQNGETSGGKRVFILEFIPKGETFDAWTQLFAIYAQKEHPGTVQDDMANTLDVYAANCAGSFHQVSRTTPPDVALYVVYCPHYNNAPQTGELAIFVTQKAGNILVRHYHHFRMPAFTAESIGTRFPVPLPKFQNAAKAVAGLRLVKSGGN